MAGKWIAPIEDPDNQKEDQRQSVADWLALLALVAALCLGFVLRVAAGYRLRALLRSVF